MVQWPILNNSHAYPLCKTTPGTTSYLDLAIAPFLSVKLAEIGRETRRNRSRNYSVSESRGAPTTEVILHT